MRLLTSNHQQKQFHLPPNGFVHLPRNRKKKIESSDRNKRKDRRPSRQLRRKILSPYTKFHNSCLPSSLLFSQLHILIVAAVMIVNDAQHHSKSNQSNTIGQREIKAPTNRYGKQFVLENTNCY